MPVVCDIPLNLNINEVLRRQGLGGEARVRPEIKSLLLEMLAELDNEHLLEPAAAYERYPVTGMTGDRITLAGGKAVHGPAVPAFFPEARELAIIVCTIGPGLEERASGYTKNGQALRGMLLDGIGSAAVDKLIPGVIKLIAAGVAPLGYEVSSPVNPGMPGLAMTEQRNITELARADRIGVSLTPSGILVPRKSVSMVIGIGPRMARWTQAEVCARCSLSESCPYKAQEQI
jgi:hypothetical protein